MEHLSISAESLNRRDADGIYTVLCRYGLLIRFHFKIWWCNIYSSSGRGITLAVVGIVEFSPNQAEVRKAEVFSDEPWDSL